VLRHHPNAGLEKRHRLADEVPQLYPGQVDDYRDSLALPGLKDLQMSGGEVRRRPNGM